MEQIIDVGVKLVATTGITELVKTTIGSYFKPKIDRCFSGAEEEKRAYLIEENLNSYIERTYKNCLYMNTIVFKNQQMKINDLYIPLTVLKCDEIQRNEKVDIYINKYKDEFIPLYRKVLLVDSAGMGKSTIMKYLYLSSITEKKGIPVFIELRRLDKDTSIIDFIMNEMNGIRQYFKKEDILKLIEGGDFIFFFDGYDEIVPEAKNKVTENLQEFISKTCDNTFIISSRDENELSCFGDFQRFDIKSLSRDEAYSLIKKYDKNGEVSNILIEKLQVDENMKILNEFLENPLMVSLLYKTFEYKRTIPYKKHIFYRQVYDALYENHDLSKGGAYQHPKRSKLDLEDFHRILRSIGFITLTKGIIYSKEEFIKIINMAKKKNIDVDFNENDFIFDVTHSVPVFAKDGIEYRWSHKSFQEYFAASYICVDAKEKQQELFIKMSEERSINKYYNVLDFCYDIDYKQFVRIIIYPIINELKQFYDDKYCDEFYNNYSKDDINLRKALEFNYKDILIRHVGENDEIDLASGNVFRSLFKDMGEHGARVGITNSKLAISFGTTKIEKLLKLLYNKSAVIAEKLDVNLQDGTITGLIDNLDVGSYRVNDSVDNELNQMDTFKLINAFIARSCRNRGMRVALVFNYDKCMELKREIEREIKDEENDINFL